MHRRRDLLALGAAAAPSRAPPSRKALGPASRCASSCPSPRAGPRTCPARLFADELSKALPQRVIVENRTGAGVVVGTEVVAKAPKDGHTLLYNTIATPCCARCSRACPSTRSRTSSRWRCWASSPCCCW
jgi:hypothetical protein